MLTNGSVTGCIYLGNSIEAGLGRSTSCVVSVNNGGTMKDCYFTNSELTDPNALLMPTANLTIDNTAFLTQLVARDEFLLGDNSRLTEKDICYDLAINGREYKAVKNADETWSRRAFTVCLPFDKEIPDEQKEDVLVYQLHQIDTENKQLIFTNDFPILKAGEPYLLVVGKGTFALSGKDVLARSVPLEPQVVYNLDYTQELGYWCGNFRKMENADLVDETAYIMQRNGTFRIIDKIYDSKPYVAQFLAYFSAFEPIGTSCKMKFVRTENGVETSELTDFPAEFFESDCDIFYE